MKRFVTNIFRQTNWLLASKIQELIESNLEGFLGDLYTDFPSQQLENCHILSWIRTWLGLWCSREFRNISLVLGSLCHALFKLSYNLTSKYFLEHKSPKTIHESYELPPPPPHPQSTEIIFWITTQIIFCTSLSPRKVQIQICCYKASIQYPTTKSGNSLERVTILTNFRKMLETSLDPCLPGLKSSWNLSFVSGLTTVVLWNCFHTSI